MAVGAVLLWGAYLAAMALAAGSLRPGLVGLSAIALGGCGLLLLASGISPRAMDRF